MSLQCAGLRQGHDGHVERKVQQHTHEDFILARIVPRARGAGLGDTHTHRRRWHPATPQPSCPQPRARVRARRPAVSASGGGAGSVPCALSVCAARHAGVAGEWAINSTAQARA